MLKDFNRFEVQKNEVFHFAHSLRPFIAISNSKEELFLDIEEMVCYTYEELDSEGLWFYCNTDDEDFMGVEVDGTLKDYFV